MQRESCGYCSIAGQSEHQTKEELASVEHQQELQPAFKFSSPKCVHVNLDLFHGLILFLNRSINTTFPYSTYRNLISIPIELNSNFPTDLMVQYKNTVPHQN